MAAIGGGVMKDCFWREYKSVFEGLANAFPQAKEESGNNGQYDQVNSPSVLSLLS
jgi:hypothetical protein